MKEVKTIWWSINIRTIHLYKMNSINDFEKKKKKKKKKKKSSCPFEPIIKSFSTAYK